MPSSLAYLGFTSPASDAWPALVHDVLGGMQVEDGPGGALRFSFDDAAWRLQIEPGDRDDLAFMGWDVDSEQSFHDHVRRLEAAGVEVHSGSPELLAQRRVQDLRWFIDPAGFRHELVIGQLSLPGRFRPSRPMVSRFVTGEQGLGHVVLGVPDLEKAHAFYTEVLGFELSDWLSMNEGKFLGRFYHCNGRHHTLALGNTPGYRGVNHIMLEVGSLDDVGSALDACIDRGVPVVNGLGRHTNDQMVSFYLQTPSSFNIEYGYGGLEVGQGWSAKLFTSGSTWGHRPQDDVEDARGILIPVD